MQYFGQTKVSVLDGGLQKWKIDGYDTSTEVPNVTDGNFEANTNSALVTSAEFMKDNLGRKEVQVLDTRPPTAFDGIPTGVFETNHIS